MKDSKHYHVYAHQDVFTSFKEAAKVVDNDNRLWGRISGIVFSYREAISECSQKHMVDTPDHSWSAVDLGED